MRVDDIYLAGIGTFLPERADAALAAEEGRYDRAKHAAGGMISVTVAGDLPAPDMAVTAVREALKDSAHDVDDIAALFYSNVHYQGPDGWSAHHYVLRQTIDRPIPAVEVRQGCNGTVASMELAACYLAAVPERTAVVLAAADNFGTPVVDRWHASELFVLADGAAAVVLSKRPGFARLLAVGSLSNPKMEELHRGGVTLFPPGITVGEKFDLEARRTYWRQQWAEGIAPPMGHLGDLVAGAVDKTLGEAGLTMSDIDRVAHVSLAHPALRDAFLDPLGIDEAKGNWDFTRRTGHAGAVDVIAGLEHLRDTGQVVPGDRVLLVGATPGMEANCAVVEMTSAAAR